MSQSGDAIPPPWPRAAPAAGGDAAASSPSAARDDAVALLRLAGLDAELARLRRSMATILGLLECQRSHLTTLAEIIEKDRLWGSEQGSREILHGQRLRLFRNQKTHAELAKVLERNEADGLAMSRELQGKAAELAEQREEVLARISQPHRERYEAAVRWGHRPFLAAVQDGGCPGCGKPLPEADRRLVQESLCVVACAGCLRLLYDRGWVERGFIPSTLRPVPKPRP